ncbi:hypothetical protein [Roseivivax isoporae]|uniref:hypothetical protein n=1 Tax=Roseivivax isoporae TaxID=591206 RepID=UPI0012EBFDEC|nr:hypothetical protein [Roseivivax isoporae]
MRHSSIIFTMLFIAVLVLSAFATLSAFLWITEAGPSYPENSIDAILEKQNINDWSSIADFLSAVVGIPVALAGSLVAIYIAHRAYIVTRNQSDFESLAFVESITERCSESYWNLSRALDKFDVAARSIPPESLTHPQFYKGKDPYDHEYSDEEKGEAAHAGKYDKKNGAAELAIQKVTDASVELSNAILAILRDPLSSRMWEAAKPSVPLPEGLVFSDERQLITRKGAFHGVDPASLAQIITTLTTDGFYDHYLNKADFSREFLLREHARKKASKKSLESPFGKSLSDAPYAKLSEPEINELQKIELLPIAVVGALENPVTRFLIAGAILGTERCQLHRTPHTLNVGAILLSIAILSFPDTSNQEQALIDYLDDNVEMSPQAKRRSRRMLLAKNISSYLSPNIKEVAEALRRYPSCLYARRAEDRQEFYFWGFPVPVGQWGG